MMTVDFSDRLTKLDIKDLPPNQQDRVIRFASELAKNLRQIRLVAEEQQKNESAQKNGYKNDCKGKKQ
jgi:mRNA-degrading endonuclease RelE of RelBE toxin-antitoxin system